MAASRRDSPNAPHRPGADWPFVASIWAFVAMAAFFLAALIAADALFLFEGRGAEQSGLSPARFAGVFREVFESRHIAASIRLTAVTCTITAALSVVIAVPVGYALSRMRLPGRSVLDALFDIPIVLPPLVVGVSLLILFARNPWGRAVSDGFGALMTERLPSALRWLDGGLPGTPLEDLHRWLGIDQWQTIYYTVPGVILAQLAVSAAFAIRTMRVTFDQLDPRREQVALTLGCTRWRAFRSVVLPEALPGVVAAASLAWARALGEFGPILVFAGATRGRTEVLSSTVFLEAQIGEIEKAVAVSLLMVGGAMLTLVITRLATNPRTWAGLAGAMRGRGPA